MVESTYQHIEPLTEREHEVLLALADGLSNQEIANTLHIALATVKWYNSQIYGKLGASNRDDAVNRAQVLGLFGTADNEILSIRHNLPQESTPFVGRNEELIQLDELLNQGETRLLTIIAQGGMGKTRLALRLAEQNLQHFPDGVYLVQLAPLESVEAVPLALANVLGIQHYESNDNIEARLLKYLQSQTMLLIFDNFEHLLDASTLLSAILAHAPQVKIIVTSRERLHLQREIVFPLTGMATPDHQHEQITDFDAIRLFVQSAQRVRPEYELYDDDLGHVIDICRLVDGLPLGIELAAGWMDTLSAERIAEEIQNGLAILETDLRDIPERHRSIQATFDRTWEGLTEQEQQTMMGLSVFRGGFTQEAAESIALANLRMLKRLVNKSLLYVHLSGRYSIHQLLRQYCANKLANAGTHSATMTGFMTYFAEFLKPKLKQMVNFEPTAFQAIRQEWGNIAFAWHTMLDFERYDLIEAVYSPMWKFSATQGYSFECTALFDKAIRQIEPLRGDDAQLLKLYAVLLLRQADLKTGIDDLRISRQLVRQAIAILEELPLSRSLLHAYGTLLWTTIPETSNYEVIKPIADKFMQTAEALGEPIYVLTTYSYLWCCDAFHQQEDYEASLRHCYNIWLAHKDIHHPQDDDFVHHTNNDVVDLLWRLEKFDEAQVVLEHALFLSERAEWLFGISNTRRQLMHIAFQAGRIDEFRQHIAAVIRWHEVRGRDWQLLGALQGFHGYGLFKLERYEEAVEVCAFVMEHPITVNIAKLQAQDILGELREILGEASYEAAYERGKTKTLKQVLNEAMAFWGNYQPSP